MKSTDNKVKQKPDKNNGFCQVNAMVMQCNCNNPEFFILTPCAYSNNGKRNLETNRHLIYKYFCFNCGGQSKNIPKDYDCITGETGINRLIKLNIAKST